MSRPARSAGLLVVATTAWTLTGALLGVLGTITALPVWTLWPIAVAGIMQGIGLMAFVRVATGKLEASVSIPISDVGMLIVTTVGAVWLFQEAMTVQKLIGLGLLVAGIALLRPV